MDCQYGAGGKQNMTMRHTIVGLNYGSEVDPVLGMLRAAFPDITFIQESTLHGSFSSSYIITAAGGFNALELDYLRALGTAFRDAYTKGFVAGWNDHAKHG